MPRKLTYDRLREHFPTAPAAVLKDAVAIAAGAAWLPRRELFDLIIIACDEERARAPLHRLALRAQLGEQDGSSNDAASNRDGQ